MIDLICQIGIALFGVSSIILVSTKGKYQKWGFVLGLLCQPFWFITTYTNEQWGIFALSFVYLFSWINGFRNHFLKRADDDE